MILKRRSGRSTVGITVLASIKGILRYHVTTTSLIADVERIATRHQAVALAMKMRRYRREFTCD